MPPSTVLPGRWRAALLVVVVTAAGLAGCARPQEAGPAAPATPAAQPRPSWPGCDATGAFDQPDGGTGPPAAGPVPPDFVPTAAVLCDRGRRTAPDGAVLRVGLERRATDIAPLLTYLAQPSEVSSHPDDLVCPAMAVLPTWLFLIDADGRWVTPALPTDVCGFPLGTFDDPGPAYPELRYRDTVVRELGVEESAEAQEAGCPMQWKLLTAEEPPALPRTPVRADPFGGGAVRVCRYGVPEEEQGRPGAAGDFEGGLVLDRPGSRRLVSGLVGSPAAPERCDQRATRFAVLRPVSGEPSLQVELDGCRRIHHPGADGGGAALAQADPALVRLVGSAGR